MTVLTGVNDAGTVVGFWSAGGKSSAFLYDTSTGQFTDIPSPREVKKGVQTGQLNNDDWFAGTYFDRHNAHHAFYAKPMSVV